MNGILSKTKKTKKKKSSSPPSDRPSFMSLFEKDPEGKSNPHLFTFYMAIALLLFCIPLSIQIAWSCGTNYNLDYFSNVLDAFNHLFDFSRLRDPYGSSNPGSSVVVWVVYVIVVFAIYIDVERRKNRSSTSKGTSHWNDWKEHNYTRTYPLDSPDVYEPPENGDMIGNAILGEKTRLDMDRVWGMNLNMMIQGSPGSGKTRYVLKPNLLQFNSSYVVTDPSAELIGSTAQAMMNHGYRVKLMNLADMSYSDKYNPFRYIKKDEDILTLVDCLMKNTDDSEASKGDQFFAKAEQCLFLSLFYYIYYEMPPEKKNLNTVMDLYREAKASEGKENFQSDLDKRFAELEKKNPNHIAVANYHTFQQGTGKTLKSILISFGVRMNPFNVPSLQNLVSDDTVHLEEIGDRKQILYIVAPTEKTTYNFIAAMMYTQLFQSLYDRSAENKSRWMLKKGPNTTLRTPVWRNSKEMDKFREQIEQERKRYMKAEFLDDDPEDQKFKEENEHGVIPVPHYRLVDPDTQEVLQDFQSKKEREIYMDCINNGEIVHSDDERLPCNVRCMLDEFANTCEIPGFDKILNTCRKYDISCNIIIQSLGQLKKMYKDDYSAIIDGCSTQMYLAVQDADDLKRVSDLLGNKTVDSAGSSRTFGSRGSSSESVNHDAEALMTVSEIRSMPAKKCIIFISGEAPFYDDKFVLENHPNYAEIDHKFFNYKQYFFIEDKVAEKENAKLDLTFRLSKAMKERSRINTSGLQKQTVYTATAKQAVTSAAPSDTSLDVTKASGDNGAVPLTETFRRINASIGGAPEVSRPAQRSLQKKAAEGKLPKGLNIVASGDDAMFDSM